MVEFLARGTVTVLLIAALWDERNEWKRISFFMIYLVAITVLGLEIRSEARQEGRCEMAETFNRSVENNEDLRENNIKDIRIAVASCDG